MKKYKWQLLVLAILIVAVFFLGKSCGVSSVKKTVDTDTTIRKDSAIVRYVPVPYKVETIKEKKIGVPYPVYVDTTQDSPYMPPDTPYEVFVDTCWTNEIAYYNDSLKSGNNKIFIKDTLRNNRIRGRGITWYSTDTTIKSTTLLTPPKKTVLLFGIALAGDRKSPFFGVSSDFSVKFPNDMIVSAGTLFAQDRLLYQVGFKIPIHLSKRK